MPEHNALARQFTLPSLMRFALPNIIMMVFLSMYTIVDGMFISRYVGTLALSSEMVTNIANAITIEGFPIYAVSSLFMDVSIFAPSLFTAFSDGRVSAIISFARTLVFLVGMLLLLPPVLGEIGVWLAVPAAELLGIAVSIRYLVRLRHVYHYGASN